MSQSRYLAQRFRQDRSIEKTQAKVKKDFCLWGLNAQFPRILKRVHLTPVNFLPKSYFDLVA
jgi:hypothetical protein